MQADDVQALRDQLALKEHEVALLLAIDRVRDTLPEPLAMLGAITKVLADTVPADLCALALRHQDAGHLELKTIYERSPQVRQWQAVLTPTLMERASRLNEVAVWSSEREGHLAMVPITTGMQECLGVLLLARQQSPFSPRDVTLLKTAESQIDSAVMQGDAYHDLQQHIKELETIYRIDHIRDQPLSLDEMLQAVLREVCVALNASTGFVMLYNLAGQALELRAATAHDLFQVLSAYETIQRLANTALQQAELVCQNDLGDVLRSAMCMPLILRQRIIGVLGVLNHQGSAGFTREERHLLQAIGSQIDTAIFESLEQYRLRQVLGRSVGPQVMERLLTQHDVAFLKGERCLVSVLYADIRGSTSLAEHTDPELLVGFINDYLGSMTEVILAHQGTVDKFVGDEVMALFGAPFPQPDHALRAIRVGLAMQEAHQKVIATWRARGVAATPIGIGIATGDLIAGEMGCAQRAEYTVIGRAANLGARICGAAQGGQVLISQATYDLVRGAVEATPIPGLQFKGVGDDITVYHVTRVSPALS